MKHLDYKVTMWCRLHFENDVNLDNVIKQVKENKLPYNLEEDSSYTPLIETETFILPELNKHTIEVWDNNNIIYTQ